MKKLYISKKRLSNNIQKGFLILSIIFIGFSASAQEGVYDKIFFPPRQGISDRLDEFIVNTSHYPSEYRGLAFWAGNKEIMRIWENQMSLNFPMVLHGDITFLSGEHNIYNVDIIQGFNDLRLFGSSDAGNEADLFISKTGEIGIGTDNAQPNGALHVLGANNNGSTATLSLGSPGQLMLLDGNKIDATSSTLYFNSNSEHNIEMANGGGNIGIGIATPTEKLQLLGNLRLDDGLFLTNNNMVFRPAVGNSSVNNNIIFQNNAEIEIMRIHKDGNVGIGTAAPSQKLEVVGTVKASSFVSSTTSFPDYVFEADYKFVSLYTLESYVKENKHLPNMPREKEVLENGLDVTDVVVKSVENIENIYLHLFHLNEKMEALQKENDALKALLNHSL